MLISKAEKLQKMLMENAVVSKEVGKFEWKIIKKRKEEKSEDK